ncbi:MAG: polysaccharide deacetylase family protein, partial [Desulfobulbaceae bacterium]|nr:polysaccharide deacetylase family protein [Desulfobulbaceae bacterium]
QELIIPLRPFDKGGLKVNGYQTVPVLAYHGFSKDSPGKMTVTEASFEAQMKYLMENGYHVISLDQLMDFLEFKEQIPEKSVVITIDNGLSSFSDIAFPILKKFGLTATLFVYTDFIDTDKALSWKQINNLSKKGFDIQCKTKTHRNLTKRKKKESFKEYFESLEKEISYPKTLIKQKLNKECSYFAYPYGATNNLAVAILIKQGYRAAFTVKRASNPCFVDRYRIHRSVIYGDYDIERFKKNLSVFNKTKLK